MLIEEARKLLRNRDKSDNPPLKMKVVPLYGSLPSDEQMRAFERTPRTCRKIVVATNIAEASVTIHGIVYVIDCGFVKIQAYNPDNGIEVSTSSRYTKYFATLLLFVSIFF